MSDSSQSSCTCTTIVRTNANLPPSPTPPWAREVQSKLTESIANDDEQVSLQVETSYLDSIEDRSVALPDGNYKGQTKRILVPGTRETDSGTWTMSGNFMSATAMQFSQIATSAVFEWDGSKWHLIGGNAEPI